jgi:regulator of protease activity HflC (stomatin/prohibitin superfamily)
MTTPPRSSLLQRLRRQVSYYLLYFVEGDFGWGQARWLAIVVVVVAFVVLGRLVEPIEQVGWFEAFARQAFLRETTPAPMYELMELIASFFTRETLRHALPPLAGSALALYLGAAYVRNLLELPALGPAYKFLTSTLFGNDYPRLSIHEGVASVHDPAANPMLKIGGPGWVDIHIGSAALFERLAGPSAVLGAGTHFLHRFETLRAAFDLREIERSKDNLKVITKDGLPLVLTDMRVRFRLKAREARSAANPYPVLMSAVRKAAYNRKVTDKGLEPWADTVTGAVVGTITAWIGRRTMDELIPPPKETGPDDVAAPSYREALHQLFNERATRQRLADLGAEVVWVSVGHLRPDPDVDPDLQPDADATGRDKIHEQFIETWKARHVAAARHELAEAQGYAQYLQDSTRAQTQAEMIVGLTSGLREAEKANVPMADVILERMLDYLSGSRYGSASEYQRLQTALLLESMQKALNPAPEPSTLTTIEEVEEAEEEGEEEAEAEFDEEDDEEEEMEEDEL